MRDGIEELGVEVARVLELELQGLLARDFEHQGGLVNIGMGELNFLDGYVHIVAGGVLQADGLEGSQQKHSHYGLFSLPRLEYRRQPKEGSQAYQAR